MPSGLIALLDDVAGIAKLAAASIDDVGADSGKAATKAAMQAAELQQSDL